MHFRSLFRGYIHICGHDKSDPYGCERFANYVANIPQNANEQSVKCATNTNEIHTKHTAKYQQTFREIPTLTHEIGCEHCARRRGPIHRARILT